MNELERLAKRLDAIERKWRKTWHRFNDLYNDQSKLKVRLQYLSKMNKSKPTRRLRD